MTDTKPQPCPWCGSECVVQPLYGCDDGAPRYSVACDGREWCDYSGPLRESEAEAIRQHNRIRLESRDGDG